MSLSALFLTQLTQNLQVAATKKKVNPIGSVVAKPVKLSASVLAKIEKMQQEDSAVAEVLNYKDRLEKMKHDVWESSEDYF